MNSTKDAAPTRGLYYYGWNIVAVCILAQAAGTGLSANCFSLFLRGWSATFHAPVSEVALAIGLETIVASMLAPLVGVWADKYPARWLFGLGLLGVSVFFLGISWATQAWQFLALYGLVFPLPLVISTTVPANTLISRWFVRRLGLALGLSSFGIGAAGIVLPPLIAHFLPLVGWRMIWRGAGVICALVVAPIVVLTARDRPDQARDGTHYLTGDAEAGAAIAHGHGPGGPSTLTWGDVFRRGNFWLLLVTVLPVLAVHIAAQQNLAPYAAAHGLSTQFAGDMMSLLFVCSLGSTLTLGMLADRFGSRRPLAGLIVLSVAGCVTLSFASNLPAILLGFALLGAAGGVFTLLGAGIGAEFGAEGFGRAFGAVLFFMPIPAFSAAVVAKAQEMTGSYAPGFMGMAAVLLIPAVLLPFMRPQGRTIISKESAPDVGEP